jgi:glycosyltransferase involved in cell wall biosynthesis
MMSTASKLVLLDHDLKAKSDSMMSHSLSFAEALLSSSVDCEIWAHWSCDISDHRVKKVFGVSQGKINSLAGTSKVKHACVLGVGNMAYLFALMRHRTPKGSVICAVNANAFIVPALQVYSKIERDARVVVYFQKSVTRSMKLLGVVNRLLRLRNVRYCTEVASMAEAYKVALRTDCAVIPCPIDASARSFRPEPHSPIGVVLGEPRHAKGFNHFVDSIEYLVPSLQEGRLRLVVQSISVEKAHADVRHSVAKLNEIKQSCPNVKVLEGPLERRLYREILSNSDFVILPYRKVSYVGQSSGIVFEALQQGKPLVITAGLSFSELARTYEACIEVADERPTDLARGVLEAVSNRRKYTDAAARVAEEITRIHSWEHALKIMVGLF